MYSARKSIKAVSGLGVVCFAATMYAPLAHSFETPECGAGEYLWLMSAGNAGTTALPNADMSVASVSFQDWSDGTRRFRTAQFSKIPQGVIGKSVTFERFSGSGTLGRFARHWPVEKGGPVIMERYDSSALKALPASNPAPIGTRDYIGNFRDTDYIGGPEGQTVSALLASPSYNGKLTYFVDDKAAVDFFAIALCTSAVPPSPVVTPPSPTAMSEAEIAAKMKAVQDAADRAKRLAQEETAQKQQAARALAELELAAQEQAAQEQALAEQKLADQKLSEQASQLAQAAEAEKLQKQKAEQETSKQAASQMALQNKADITAQTKRDMITTAGIAATIAGSAALNALGNVLSSLMRGGANLTPTAPAPAPPAPSPISQAGAIGQDRKKRKNKSGKNKSDKNKSEKDDSLNKFQIANKGIIFPHSVSHTTALPSDIPAYHAVGRVGYAFETGENDADIDYAYGTAILIAPDKVMTNYHIWKYYLQDIGGDVGADVGIEFGARDGSGVSEFTSFADVPPTILRGMDAVVLTLKQPSTRTPIWPSAEGTPVLATSVYAVGYTLAPKERPNQIERIKMKAVFGDNPVWGVKRWSAGEIVEHDNDTVGDIIYEAPLPSGLGTEHGLALCHTASTRGGNSGGAIINADSGAWLGLHFGGSYLDSQDVNYAVPAAELLRGLAAAGIEPPEASPLTLPITPPPITPPPITPPPIVAPKIADDLTRIEGIGPKTQAALRAQGFGSYESISWVSPARLSEALAAENMRRSHTTTWPAQAALAHAGEWERLKDWQDILHSGRKPNGASSKRRP